MKKLFNIYTSTVFGAIIYILSEYIKSESISVIGFTLFFSGMVVIIVKLICK